MLEGTLSAASRGRAQPTSVLAWPQGDPLDLPLPHRSDRYRVRTAILSGSCIPACAKGTPKRGQEAAPGTAALAVSGLALVAYGGPPTGGLQGGRGAERGTDALHCSAEVHVVERDVVLHM